MQGRPVKKDIYVNVGLLWFINLLDVPTGRYDPIVTGRKISKPMLTLDIMPTAFKYLGERKSHQLIIGNTRLKRKHMNLPNDRVIIQFYVRGSELQIKEDQTIGGIVNKGCRLHTRQGFRPVLASLVAWLCVLAI